MSSAELSEWMIYYMLEHKRTDSSSSKDAQIAAFKALGNGKRG